ncbi:MAG: hypothetical protein ACPGUF_07875, partial [Litorivicinus sp.]
MEALSVGGQTLSDLRLTAPGGWIDGVLDSQVALAGHVMGEPATLAAGVVVTGNAWQLGGLSGEWRAWQIKGDLSGDLEQLTEATGELGVSGRAGDADVSAEVNLQGADATVQLTVAGLAGRGWSMDPQYITAQVSPQRLEGQWRGTGSVQRGAVAVPASIDVPFTGAVDEGWLRLRPAIRLGDIALSSATPVRLSADDGSVSGRLSVLDGEIGLTGRYQAGMAEFSADWTNLDVALLGPWLERDDIRGRVSGQIAMPAQGFLDAAAGSMDLVGLGVGPADAPTLDARVMAELSGNQVTGLLTMNDSLDAFVAEASGTLTLAASKGWVRRADEVQASASIRGEVEPVWALLGPADLRLTGRIEGRAEASGTVSAPMLTASVDWTEGEFEDAISGLW